MYPKFCILHHLTHQLKLVMYPREEGSQAASSPGPHPAVGSSRLAVTSSPASAPTAAAVTTSGAAGAGGAGGGGAPEAVSPGGGGVALWSRSTPHTW